MVIDAVTDKLFRQPFDRGGRIAASGKVLEKVIHQMLHRDFFRKAPPKTAGREEFGREFVREFLRSCGRCRKQDAVATATALTAKAIAEAIQRYTIKNSARKAPLSGDDSFRRRREKLYPGNDVDRRARPHRIAASILRRIRLPSAAKEAVAFAILAPRNWHRHASNVPSARAQNAQQSSVKSRILKIADYRIYADLRSHAPRN